MVRGWKTISLNGVRTPIMHYLSAQTLQIVSTSISLEDESWWISLESRMPRHCRNILWTFGTVKSLACIWGPPDLFLCVHLNLKSEGRLPTNHNWQVHWVWQGRDCTTPGSMELFSNLIFQPCSLSDMMSSVSSLISDIQRLLPSTLLVCNWWMSWRGSQQACFQSTHRSP